MSNLILDTSDLERHKKIGVFERTKQLSDSAVKHDWGTNSVTHAPDGDRPTTNLQAQLGRPLTRTQIEQRLKLCNQNFFIETSTKDKSKAGVYIVVREPDEIGVIRSRKRFLVGMEAGFSPEFSVRHTIDEEVPNPSCPGEMTKRPKFVGETRGWRTVVATLIRSGFTDKESATKHFELNKGQESRNWHLLTN